MFLGRRLADIRRYEGLSQKELAATLSVDRNTISAYENGTKNPSLSKVVMIAKYFNVSADYFFGLVDQPIPIDRKDVIPLPKGFPTDAIPKVKEYIDLIIRSVSN